MSGPSVVLWGRYRATENTKECLHEGWALTYRDYSDKYVPQENVARAASKGIWAMQFVPPWEWRRGER